MIGPNLKNEESLSILIPCFNEEAAIDIFIPQVIAAQQKLLRESELSSVDIIIIDDASADKSFELLEKYKSAIQILRNERRLGYGASIKRGILHSRASLNAIIDLDCTYNAHEFVQLTRILLAGQLEMVSGNRLQAIQGMPWIRSLGNHFFKNIIRWLYGYPVLDSASGMKVFRRRSALQLLETLPNKLDFAMALTIAFIKNQQTFAEVNISYDERVGRSKLSVLSDGFRFLYRIISYR